MREIERTGDSVLLVDIIQHSNSRDSTVTFYRQIDNQAPSKLTSFILSYPGATNLIIELQKHLIYRTN